MIVFIMLGITTVAVLLAGGAVHRMRFWKSIAEEAQTSTTFWRRQYESLTAGSYAGERSWVSVEREGPSAWLDVEHFANGGD